MAKPLRRGYSLMSVLAALIILLAVLMPLLPLQGKLFRRASHDLEREAINIINQDIEQLEGSGTIRARSWEIQGHPLKRRPSRLQTGLQKLTYELENKDGRLILQITRWHYTGK